MQPNKSSHLNTRAHAHAHTEPPQSDLSWHRCLLCDGPLGENARVAPSCRACSRSPSGGALAKTASVSPQPPFLHTHASNSSYFLFTPQALGINFTYRNYRRETDFLSSGSRIFQAGSEAVRVSGAQNDGPRALRWKHTQAPGAAVTVTGGPAAQGADKLGPGSHARRDPGAGGLPTLLRSCSQRPQRSQVALSPCPNLHPLSTRHPALVPLRFPTPVNLPAAV